MRVAKLGKYSPVLDRQIQELSRASGLVDHSDTLNVYGWTSGTDATQDKHISNANGKKWEDHVNITNANPHGTDHSALDSIAQADDTSSNTDGGKHVTNALVKKYEDHRNDSSVHQSIEAIQDAIATFLLQGTAITLTYNDSANTLTIAVVASAASTDASTTVTGTAGGTYGSTEQTMINALATDVGALKTSLNDLKAKMRTAGLLAT